MEMTVGELIKRLETYNEDQKVLISCEGGCVVDGDIEVFTNDNKVYLSIY